MDSTTALLLRKTKFSETSLILTWLTTDHGKLKTLAKGARQPKSRFSGRIDLFFECEISIARSRKSDLHTLRECELREPHDGLRQDYRRVTMGAYFIELIEIVTEPEHSVPELYDLLRRALRYLDANPATMRALEHFERELVRLLGIEHPEVAPVASLGRTYHRLPTSRRDILGML